MIEVTRPIDLTKKVDLMLDSGAYTCWKQGKTLEIGAYIKFIQKWYDHLHVVVNLDAIPGRKRGLRPTESEVEESAKEGYANLQLMRKEGINALPVFHVGERRYWLEKMLDDGYDYIGLGGSVGRNTKEKAKWLDEVFGYLCGSEGYPKVRVHGFAVTSLPLLHNYPWYSLDSTSWIIPGALGGILVPRPHPAGGYDFGRAPTLVMLSDRPSAMSKEHARHYDALGLLGLPEGENSFGIRAYVDKYLSSEGLDGAFKLLRSRKADLDKQLKEAEYPDLLAKYDFDWYWLRRQINAHFFVKVTKAFVPKPFFRSKRLFTSTGSREGQSEYPWGHIKIIFGMGWGDTARPTLNDEGVRDRLLSFYYLDAHEGHELGEYIRCGILPRNQRRRRRSKEKV